MIEIEYIRYFQLLGIHNLIEEAETWDQLSDPASLGGYREERGEAYDWLKLKEYLHKTEVMALRHSRLGIDISISPITFKGLWALHAIKTHALLPEQVFYDMPL